MRLIEYLVMSSLHHIFQKIIIRAAPPKCAHYVALHWKSQTRCSSSHPVGPLEEDFWGPGGMELGSWKYGTWRVEQKKKKSPGLAVCAFSHGHNSNLPKALLPGLFDSCSTIPRSSDIHSKHVSFYFLSSVITYFGKVRVGTWEPINSNF